MAIEVLYSDVHLQAGAVPQELVFNADSLNQNIASIFETKKKSRWFRPRIGSDVSSHLFEPIDEITASRIRYDMERALADNLEHRLVFDEIVVIPDPAQEQYYVSITYRAPELDARQFTFTFNLARGFG